MDYFIPLRHIPPTNLKNSNNTSKIRQSAFDVLQSMKNSQMLTLCGCVNNYIYRYIVNIEENNYVVISVDRSINGSLLNCFAQHKKNITKNKRSQK